MIFFNSPINRINANIACGIGIIIMCYFFLPVLLHPNSYLFNFTGDAAKNYYTYAHYIKNSPDYINFDGMNYPYGENFLFTDCHPILAVFLKIVNEFVDISRYSVGIVNYLLVLSLFVTGVILFKIFKLLNVNFIFALLGSIGLSMLNPQIPRFYGHFALAYSFAIPLIIYLLLKLQVTKQPKKIFLWIFFFNLTFFFVHAYFGMILAAFVLLFAVVKLIGEKLSKGKSQFNFRALFASALLPIMLFFVFTKLSDTHVGRSNNPWGIEENHSEISSIILPNTLPFSEIAMKLFPNSASPWEGHAYIGFANVLVLPFGVLFFIIKYFKQKRKMNEQQRYLLAIFGASFGLLLFALFIPFRWNLEFLIDYLNVIKQFRALGRFAWVFYYCTGIVSIVFLQIIFNRMYYSKMKYISLSLILLPAFTLFEGFFPIKQLSQAIIVSVNKFDREQLDKNLQVDLKAIDSKDYQAILSFPFFCVGSENYGKLPTNDKILNLSFIFSYHLNIPLVASMLSRVSVGESKASMQLLSESFYTKLLKKEIKSKKPFLLVCYEENLNEQEKLLISKSKCIVKREGYSLYTLAYSTVFGLTNHREFMQFDQKKAKLFLKNDLLVSDTSLFSEYIDFTASHKEISHHGKNGSLKIPLKETITLYTIENKKLQLNKTYKVRFWIYNKGKNDGQDLLNNMVLFEKRSGKNELLTWLPSTSASRSTIIDGFWSMVEQTFVNDDPNGSHLLLHVGNGKSIENVYIDHLLFFDSDLEIYKYNQNGEFLMKNNHWINLKN
jgi:hypothetical protein